MSDVFAIGMPGDSALYTELDSTAIDNLHRYADPHVPISNQIQRGELKVKMTLIHLKQRRNTFHIRGTRS